MLLLESKLSEIASCLFEKNYDKHSASLMGGALGVSMFLLYYHEFTGDEKYYDKAVAILQQIVENEVFDDEKISFANGISGLAWFIEFCRKKQIIEIDTTELFVGIDEILYQKMIAILETGNYDYLHGGLGIYYYFLYKDQTPDAVRYLNHAIQILEKISIIDTEERTIKWCDINFKTSTINAGCYNLGLAHGIPGIIVILSKTIQQNIEIDQCLKLLKGAISYISGIYNTANYSGSPIFPHLVSENETMSSYSRLGWCYGDLSVALALWHGNQILKDETLDKTILSIVLNTATRTNPTSAMVYDAGLCHGANGIAHIFNKFYQIYKAPDFKVASDYWLNIGLKFASFNNNLAGFKAFHSIHGYYDAEGLLEGLAGIGLSYITYLNPLCTDWDETLLIS